jgi:transcriptional regulator with XRE-family HTH domain
MDIRQVLATNLRRLRHAKGLSQEELAFRAKINRTYVSKLETGATWAGLEVIAKVARVLGVEAADLLVRPKRANQRRG